MMAGCIDPEIGALIHMYELDTLSDEDTERFEIHMMNCEFCFHEVQDLTIVARLLRSDGEVSQLAVDHSERQSDTRPSPGESFTGRIRRYLWPDVPLVFRPAFAYIVLVLVAAPLYYSLRMTPGDPIRPVQTLNLTSARSAAEGSISLSTGKDVLISFRYADAEAGKAYSIVLETVEGMVIFSEGAFSDFDEFGTGRLLVPLERLHPGKYRLVVRGTADTPEATQSEFRFTITE